MFATFQTLHHDGRVNGEVRINPAFVTTLEDGPHGELYRFADLQTTEMRITSTRITLKDKRAFVVKGTQDEVAIELKLHTA